MLLMPCLAWLSKPLSGRATQDTQIILVIDAQSSRVE